MDAILLNGVNNQSATSTSIDYSPDAPSSSENLNDTSNDFDDINLALTTTAVIWFFVYFHGMKMIQFIFFPSIFQKYSN